MEKDDCRGSSGRETMVTDLIGLFMGGNVRNEGTLLPRRTVVVSHGKKVQTPVLVDHTTWPELVE